MATTTQHPKTGAPTVDAAFEQLRDVNEQVLAAARKAGNLFLDSYEQTVDRAIELELKVAGMTQQEWLRSLVDAQTEITRELTSSYTKAARGLLK